MEQIFDIKKQLMNFYLKNLEIKIEQKKMILWMFDLILVHLLHQLMFKEKSRHLNYISKVPINIEVDLILL
jgi:hypothetical protein